MFFVLLWQMLAEPHRRLVSSCSLLEINDPTKKDKKHIREVFLLNDMLLVGHVTR